MVNSYGKKLRLYECKLIKCDRIMTLVREPFSELHQIRGSIWEDSPKIMFPLALGGPAFR